MGHVARIASSVADLVYPPHCLICGVDIGHDHEEKLCNECRNSIPFISGRACARCGAPVGEHTVTDGCPQCSGRRLAFSMAAAAGRYEGVLRELILQLKYGHRGVLAAPMAALMLRCAEKNSIAGGMDFVVPVPLHTRKLTQRGFNQAELLARRVAAHLGIQVRSDVLVRVKNTPSQTGLDRPSRRRNVAGAFAVPADCDLGGARLLLVDDVMTTGSTLSECASALRRAGVDEVRVLVAARG